MFSCSVAPLIQIVCVVFVPNVLYGDRKKVLAREQRSGQAASFLPLTMRFACVSFRRSRRTLRISYSAAAVRMFRLLKRTEKLMAEL